MANPYRHYASGDPYFDDFDPTKNYMKVLYRPGVAVQARELTQSQTYLNNQLAALGGYFFKDGTPIDGAKISFSTKQPAMKIETPQSNNPENYIKEHFLGGTFEGLNSHQSILITDYYLSKDDNDNITGYYLLFSYYGSILYEGETFRNEENHRNTFTMLGKPFNALVAACSEGTIFIDGYFVHIPKSSSNIVVAIDNDTTTGKEYHIGFNVSREFITQNKDSSLNDNALGSYNYKAPGAHRLKVSASLAAYEGGNIPTNTDGSEIPFIPGIVIKDGILIKDQPCELDGNLADLLARRTYEESGSYTVNPWKIQIKDHETDKSKYIVSIEPGMGYIYGYRVSNLVSQEIEVEKPRTFIPKEGNVDYISDSVYTYAKFESDGSATYDVNSLQAYKFPDFLRMEEVYVMSSVGEVAYNVGNKLGTCLVADAYKQGGYFLIYLTDINNVAGSFGSAKSLVSKSDVDNGVTKPRYVNLRLNEDGAAELIGTDNPKIIPTGYSMVTPIVQDEDTGDYINYFANSIEYSYLKTFNKIASSSTSLNFEDDTNIPIDRSGLIYIYNQSTGKHIDITNLFILKDEENNCTIKHQENKNVFESGNTYVICVRVTIKNGTVRTKDVSDVIKKEVVIKDNDKIILDHEDIIEIVRVYESDDANKTDVKSSLVFDNGQTDYLYDYGSLSGFNKLNEDDDTIEKKYTIEYRYYTHTGFGPFVASSYIDTSGSNASKLANGSNEELYTKLPIYRSKNTNKVYKLRDCLDFRVKRSKLNGLTYYPNARTSVRYDLGVYLPRIDAVWVDKNGNFGVTQGIPSQSPEPPEEKDGVMTIYYLYNEAYGENVNVKYINNQRHTMSEITELENRLTNVENVLSLSMLEQSAVNMQITDEDGLNRYKTGIFTDNFSSYDNSDYTNEDWNASIDAVECSIRPLYDCVECGFEWDGNKTKNVESMDGVVLTLKPTSTEIFAKNDAISEQTNIQSLMFYVWNGALTLTPSIDTWVTDLGNILVSETWIETPKPPTAYRVWSVSTTTDVKTSTKTSTSTQRRNANDGWGSYWTDTYKTTATTKTATIQTKTTTETTSYTGSWTTSNVYTKMESQDTYMRERVIAYSLKGMRPGMLVSATMDSVPLTLSNRIIKSDGTLEGTFTIPEKMTVGTKLVEFFDAEDTSAASAEYTANGKTVWTNVDRTYLRTWTALVSTNTQTSYSTKDLGTTTNTTKVSSVYRNLDPIAESFYVDSPNGIMLESIDIFFAKKDNNVNVEVFVVECENGYPSQTMVPFSRVSISPNDYEYKEVEIGKGEYIKTANDEYEKVTESNKTIGNYVKDYKLKLIGTTELDKIKSGAKTLDDYATNFKFSSPLYLSPETEYAFIVIAPSYNYEIYTSTLGKADLISGIGIKEQPYIGSMFKSQNLRTWTAEQLSDITFRIHKYKFANSTGSASFKLNTPKNIESTMQTLALNTFVPNQTNINYSYKWSGDTVNVNGIPFNNKEDIFNTKKKIIGTKRNNIDTLPEGVEELTIICDISTLDDNISPMIDLEQVYGIFTNNIVNATSDKKLISDNLVPFDENGDRVTTDSKVIGKYNFYCGTYISNPVTLENAGEDLRVILDAILPNSSDIKVSFKTTTYNPLYVVQGKKGYCISEDEIVNNIGKTMQMYWYKETKDEDGKITSAQLENPYGTNSASEAPKCIITGYSNDKVYIRSISDQSKFKSYSEVKVDDNGNEILDENGNEIFDNVVDINYNAIYLLPILNEDVIKCPIWTSITFPEGSYVMWDKCIWRANRDTAANNTPSEYSIVWDKISGIKVISEVETDDTVVWRPMTSEVVNINTTKSSSSISTEENFKEYTFYPELEIESEFKDFTIRIDLYSQDEVNIPRVKNLRAIALV